MSCATDSELRSATLENTATTAEISFCISHPLFWGYRRCGQRHGHGTEFFICPGRRQNQPVSESVSNDLQSHRQPRRGQAAGNRKRGLSRDVERVSERCP